MSLKCGLLEARLGHIWDGYVRGSSNTFVVLRDIVTETEKIQTFSEGRASHPMREALEFYVAALEECSDAVQEGMVTKGLLMGRIPAHAQKLVHQADKLLQGLPEQLPDFLCDIG